MAIWLVRAGSHGEYGEKLIKENKVFVTWEGLDVDLSKMHQRSGPGSRRKRRRF